MSFHVRWEPRLLHFRQPAGTSRGVYRTRQIWLLHLTCDTLPGREGIGECAPLPDLSIEWDHFFEKKLYRAGSFIEEKGPQAISLLKELPSVLFAFETALRHLSVGDFALWNTPFSCNQEGISINGLVWMGTEEQMLSQIEHKLSVGYRCIKLKIGAIDFEKELGLLSFIRRQYSPEEVEIRVDANGAFFPQEAPEKLFRLAALGLHSIEQPIAPGQWEAMARLCQISPLPIALDEELIGIHTSQRKREMLQKILPRYIVLKPSLHGGWSGCQEWINIAEELGIGWWVTSALESNIGLNAIAQWCATLPHTIPQGLGTGQLFTDNIALPLYIEKNSLWYGGVPFLEQNGI